jgi:hypothetical protein
MNIIFHLNHVPISMSRTVFCLFLLSSLFFFKVETKICAKYKVKGDLIRNLLLLQAPEAKVDLHEYKPSTAWWPATSFPPPTMEGAASRTEG